MLHGVHDGDAGGEAVPDDAAGFLAQLMEQLADIGQLACFRVHGGGQVAFQGVNGGAQVVTVVAEHEERDWTKVLDLQAVIGANGGGAGLHDGVGVAEGIRVVGITADQDADLRIIGCLADGLAQARRDSFIEQDASRRGAHLCGH